MALFSQRKSRDAELRLALAEARLTFSKIACIRDYAAIDPRKLAMDAADKIKAALQQP